MERFPTTHRKGGRARTAFLQKARTYQRLRIPIANCVDDDQVTNMTLAEEVEVLDGPILSMNPTSTKAPWLFSQGAFVLVETGESRPGLKHGLVMLVDAI